MDKTLCSTLLQKFSFILVFLTFPPPFSSSSSLSLSSKRSPSFSAKSKLGYLIMQATMARPSSNMAPTRASMMMAKVSCSFHQDSSFSGGDGVEGSNSSSSSAMVGFPPHY